METFDEKDKPIDRYYYMNIVVPLKGEVSEEALIAVEADRKVKTNFRRDVILDLSTPQLECEQLYFPWQSNSEFRCMGGKPSEA